MATLQIPQRRAGTFAAVVAANHAAALFPAALALYLVGGRAVLGMRLSMPTSPLWPLKNSQPANPAGPGDCLAAGCSNSILRRDGNPDVVSDQITQVRQFLIQQDHLLFQSIAGDARPVQDPLTSLSRCCPLFSLRHRAELLRDAL